MERSADWLAQAQGDPAHARHDVAAGFYDSRRSGAIGYACGSGHRIL